MVMMDKSQAAAEAGQTQAPQNLVVAGKHG
jgi:hypothetical protein